MAQDEALRSGIVAQQLKLRNEPMFLDHSCKMLQYVPQLQNTVWPSKLIRPTRFQSRPSIAAMGISTCPIYTSQSFAGSWSEPTGDRGNKNTNKKNRDFLLGKTLFSRMILQARAPPGTSSPQLASRQIITNYSKPGLVGGHISVVTSAFYIGRRSGSAHAAGARVTTI